MNKGQILLSGILAVTLLILGFPAISQEAKPASDRVEAAFVAHITQAVNLSPQEAERFWPLYNQFKAKRESIKDEQRALFSELNEGPATTRRADELLQRYFALEREEDDVNERYYASHFKEIIGAQRVVTLMRAEKEFRKLLLERLKDMRETNNRRPPRQN